MLDKKLNVGDKVKIKEDLEVDKMYGKSKFTSQMKKMRGKIGTVSYIFGGSLIFFVEEYNYSLTPEMVEKVSK